mgnify:CR=1 FL=1
MASCSAVVLAQVRSSKSPGISPANADVRLKAVRLLKSAANPAAAVPLAAAVTDSEDTVQFEAIARGDEYLSAGKSFKEARRARRSR